MFWAARSCGFVGWWFEVLKKYWVIYSDQTGKLKTRRNTKVAKQIKAQKVSCREAGFFKPVDGQSWQMWLGPWWFIFDRFFWILPQQTGEMNSKWANFVCSFLIWVGKNNQLQYIDIYNSKSEEFSLRTLRPCELSRELSRRCKCNPSKIILLIAPQKMDSLRIDLKLKTVFSFRDPWPHGYQGALRDLTFITSSRRRWTLFAIAWASSPIWRIASRCRVMAEWWWRGWGSFVWGEGV